MTTEEMMTIDERYKYLRIIRPRYLLASRAEKSRLLDEMEAVTGLDRKTLIRLMRKEPKRRPRRKQRGAIYKADFDDALRVIAESMDYICAERLTPNLAWLAQHLEEHGELSTTPELLGQLEQVSITTVRRRLKRISQDEPRLPRKGPRRANRLARDIPEKRIPWDEMVPGHCEVDLVHHSGPSASGEYVYTLQMIDVATGWSERAAILGRSYRVVEDAFLRILDRLPFPVLEIHPDNGGEFLNYHLISFWQDIVQGVRLSRSRPYQKNDNRFVEQKNATLVRAYLGYERLDTVEQTNALNLLYDKMWLYYNMFQPVMRLVEKTYIPAAEGKRSQVKRRYDQACTPFDRLCQTDAILPEHREQLEALRGSTNPRQLRQEIYEGIDQVLSLPGAVPGKPEDIHETLYTISRQGVGIPVTLSFERTIILR